MHTCLNPPHHADDLACLQTNGPSKCTAYKNNIDGVRGRRTHGLTKALMDAHHAPDEKTLGSSMVSYWYAMEHKSMSQLNVFTREYPRADIHELIAPDILGIKSRHPHKWDSAKRRSSVYWQSIPVSICDRASVGCSANAFVQHKSGTTVLSDGIVSSSRLLRNACCTCASLCIHQGQLQPKEIPLRSCPVVFQNWWLAVSRYWYVDCSATVVMNMT